MKKEKELILFYEAENFIQEKSDNGQLEKLIKKGLKVNMKDQHGITLAERAVFGSINYDALFVLWRAKANPPTELIKGIFKDFENGKSPQDFYKIEALEKKQHKVREIATSFSVKKLKLDFVSFEIIKYENDFIDDQFELLLNLEPFLFKGFFTETTLHYSFLCDESMKKKIFSEEGFTFKADSEIAPSFIYIQNAHNPVDLKSIKIKRGRKYFTIETQLYFDFEYEKTGLKNEILTWTFKTNKNSP